MISIIHNINTENNNDNACLSGHGPLQIAKQLESEQILVPSAYYQSVGRKSRNQVQNPYQWDQKFNPDAEQGSGKTNFTDVSPLAYYGAPVWWAVKHGITNGISSVLFAPLQSCTRAQAVTFLYRYSQL